MKSWSLFILSILLYALPSVAQIAPLPVDDDTIALWNFNDDQDDVVVDIAPLPLNGTAYVTVLESIPGADPAFGLARKFLGQSSFVDLGVVQGGKLDFTAADQFTIEAVINLTGAATENHIIFSSENTRLMIVNNQLAAYVRQPGGLFGVVSDRTLSLNTPYRVAASFRNQFLAITINDRTEAMVKLDFPIAAPQFSNSRAYIGGDIFARFFPGHIDDVRVQRVSNLDMQGPGISIVEPASFQVTNPRPNFLIQLSDDDTGVDASTVEVYLNGIRQNSLTVTEAQISGLMEDELSTLFLNEVRIVVRDFQGNLNQKSFFFSFSNISSRQEYETDPYTLGLWHMNDPIPGHLQDDSGNGRHGYGEPNWIQVADGVFGKGRMFVRNNPVNFDAIRFNDKKFTFEGWFNPVSNGDEEILLYNGQIKVARYSGGFIRVVLYTTRGEKTYLSPQSLLPTGELHHFAVTWNGNQTTKNLKFFVDGTVAGNLDAVYECDFAPVPKIGIIGQNFAGLMDELRFSSIDRIGFSVPILENQVITYQTLANGSSTNDPRPEFHATLNSSTEINVASVKIRLNGAVQSPGPELSVSATGINGRFTDLARPGLNTLDVEFLDTQGNQRKKSQYFFFINRTGGRELVKDPETAALWNFNYLTSGAHPDATGNENNLPRTTFVPGDIGLASREATSFSGKMPLNCRSFTIEGKFKSTTVEGNYRTLYNLSNPSYGQILAMTPSNGNVYISFTASNGNSIFYVPGAIPVDNAYHHVAVIYDGSRRFSQLTLVVDGQVKRTIDYQNSCDFTGNNSFTIGDSTYFSFDDVRVSRKARYDFSLQDEVSDRPSLVSTSPVAGDTVTSPTVTMSFSVDDADGVSTSDTKLFVNGTEAPVQAQQKSQKGLVTTFTSELNLIPGANQIVIKMRDLKNNEQVKSFFLYRFGKLASAPYVADPSTLLLFHFDEASPGFSDSSASNQSIPGGGWNANLSGVFNSAASNFAPYGNYINLGNLSALTGYTMESWKKGIPVGDSLIFGHPEMHFGTTSTNQPRAYLFGTTIITTANLPQDQNWHHYALVVDTLHPIQSLYFLVDGKVIHSDYPEHRLKFQNFTGASIGPQLYGSSIDEVRLSSVPRYEMVTTIE